MNLSKLRRVPSLGSTLTRAFAASLVLALSACGGGGGGGDSATAAAAVSVSISASPTSATAGQTVSLTWNASNATGTCTASGDWSGSKATSGTESVTVTSVRTYTFSLNCNGVSSSASVPVTAVTAATATNTAAMVVDNGPTGATGVINQPYVSVKVCVPGTTTCQTIDHVLVDTGSYGLRLNVALDGVSLPAVTTPSGAAAGECGQFVSGYVWGPVVKADVTVGGETASSLPIQLGGTPTGLFATVPAACSNTGNNLGTVAALGAKGILGIGLFKEDCGADCVNTATNMYYGCTSSGCTKSAMPLASQVSNPVSSFAVNNNGVALVFPSVSTAGATALTGSLVFGVDTQSNNALSTETAYKASSLGNYTIAYNGVTYDASFLDSGSNGIYFDSSLATCTNNTDFYCPATATTLSLTTSSYDASTSGTVSVQLVSVDNLDSTVNAAYIGGPMSSLSTGSNSANYADAFDLGLPFFFGRKVFVVIEGSSATKGAGPYWAY
jgi:hypothetical protein